MKNKKQTKKKKTLHKVIIIAMIIAIGITPLLTGMAYFL